MAVCCSNLASHYTLIVKVHKSLLGCGVGLIFLPESIMVSHGVST